jgi:hypothetical protein
MAPTRIWRRQRAPYRGLLDLAIVKDFEECESGSGIEKKQHIGPRVFTEVRLSNRAVGCFGGGRRRAPPSADVEVVEGGAAKAGEAGDSKRR